MGIEKWKTGQATSVEHVLLGKQATIEGNTFVLQYSVDFPSVRSLNSHRRKNPTAILPKASLTTDFSHEIVDVLGDVNIFTAAEDSVLVIAVLLKMVMKRRISIIQWEALALLLIGISINQIRYFIRLLNYNGSSSCNGCICLFIYLYAIFNFLGILRTVIIKGPESFDILQGHSKATMLLIVNNAAQGILSSFFFKCADTILKKYPGYSAWRGVARISHDEKTTNDDICSIDCKSEVLDNLKNSLETKTNQNLVKGRKFQLEVSESGGDSWDFNQHRWSTKKSSLSSYECWKCKKAGHLAEDSFVMTWNPQSSNGSSFIPKDLLELYKRGQMQCVELGIPPVNKNLKDPDGWIVSLSKKLAMWWSWVAEGDLPLTTCKRAEVSKYKELDSTIRHVVLKTLLSYINDEVKFKNEMTTFRKNNIEEDGKGTSYWYDGNEVIGFRLYKEVNTFKKNEIQTIWETLATNLEEFQKVVDEYSSSKSKLEVAVSGAVENEVMHVLNKLQKGKEERDVGVKRQSGVTVAVGSLREPISNEVDRSCILMVSSEPPDLLGLDRKMASIAPWYADKLIKSLSFSFIQSSKLLKD
ncbi:hypothetical protein L2E82_07791 [Cichorium intybus]|uniref:Uncharacterized protein n=1 Tax=Cichorium intybus TaxID=13427 RepID=A0ACB9G4U9_CICIN|nr:hypothetical protein L2E82_07791 [Cichorium intybus]